VRRLRLVLEYDGTRFCGFQRQPEGPSIQACIEDELSRVCGHPVTVVAAGRTDAGVHALGQVLHLDTEGRIAPDRLLLAVNTRLAPRLVIRRAEETEPEFHARFSAASRTYHYWMAREWPSPFLGRYVLHAPRLRADAAERMRAALDGLSGTHDFGAFCAAGAQVHTTVRTVQRAALVECGGLLRLELTADGFLHSMVRIITGLLLEIGSGAREPEALVQARDAPSRGRAAMTAPAHGLFLARVAYRDGFVGGPDDAGDRPWPEGR
jgi:tRNA pseudouridine38-40 synthase